MLGSIAAIFGQLSLLAFGGGNTILPEMQRQVVEVHRWMSASDFTSLFALAQAAPGPNLMIVTLLGWRLAGLPGALVATFCQFTPSALVTGLAVAAWQRFHTSGWRRLIAAGLVPITVGLVAASATVIARSADKSWFFAALTALVAGVTLTTRTHPLCLLAFGALYGWFGGLFAM